MDFIDIIFLAVFLGIWFLLVRIILPKMGVPT